MRWWACLMLMPFVQPFSSLRIFSPQHFKNSIPYEDGWDSLARLPGLQRLEIADEAAAANAESIQRLSKERPGIVIDNELTRSRNYDGL